MPGSGCHTEFCVVYSDELAELPGVIEIMEMQGNVHSAYGLEQHGIRNVNAIYWNLSTSLLYEEAIRRREGRIAHLGPLVVRTGEHTGRSPNDKFIVNEPGSADKVGWGKVNKP